MIDDTHLCRMYHGARQRLNIRDSIVYCAGKAGEMPADIAAQLGFDARTVARLFPQPPERDHAPS